MIHVAVSGVVVLRLQSTTCTLELWCLESNVKMASAHLDEVDASGSRLAVQTVQLAIDSSFALPRPARFSSAFLALNPVLGQVRFGDA